MTDICLLCPRRIQVLKRTPEIFLLRNRFQLFSLFLLLVTGVWSVSTQQLLSTGGGDDRIEHFPDRVFSGQIYRSGHMPLWNPYLFGGFDQASVRQPGTFYPPNLLYAVVQPVVAFNLLMVGHLLLIFYFMRRLLMAHGLSSSAVAFGALSFTLCGFLTVHLGMVPMVNACAWVPAIFYLFERWLQTRRVVYCLWAGACVALELLESPAGHKWWF